jgi:hypothetical protein
MGRRCGGRARSGKRTIGSRARLPSPLAYRSSLGQHCARPGDGVLSALRRVHGPSRSAPQKRKNKSSAGPAAYRKAQKSPGPRLWTPGLNDRRRQGGERRRVLLQYRNPFAPTQGLCRHFGTIQRSRRRGRVSALGSLGEVTLGGCCHACVGDDLGGAQKRFRRYRSVASNP